MEKIWSCSAEKLMREFNVSDNGLSGRQAEMVLKEKGENVLEGKQEISILRVFISQFADLLVVILIAAAVISMISGNIESTVVIFTVLVVNAVLGTVQYIKAKHSLDSLKKLSSPSAKVIRDGRQQEVISSQVVPGDIVMLEAGDMVVADGRILECFSLRVNESALTGEVEGVEKNDGIISSDAVLADRTNMVYSGSLVIYGRAKVLITATGMDTELGRIAGLMNEIEEHKTPLQISLDHFGNQLAVMIMVICAFIFVLCMYRGMGYIDALMFAVALAVAAIPEALGSIVTIVQAMGTSRMAKQNAIIKELNAVESLGCVSVICSDKTGTLTQNKMTVQYIFSGGRTVAPGQLDNSFMPHKYLLYAALLANDASISGGRNIGDPTECALLEMYRAAVSNSFRTQERGADEEKLRQGMKRLEELPFDSERKLMSVKYKIDGVITILVKGAADVLINRCIYILTESGIIPVNRSIKEQILNQNIKFSEQGLRVLAFAYCESDKRLTPENERDFTFIGLVSMMDPPRAEAAKAVSDAQRAGIKPVMITGDHKITATAIAEKIGIYQKGDMAVTGAELDSFSDRELESKISNISVYARVTPENKIRIVKAWQKKGRIVAMTGDGVNDAPALKQADIGVAMGMTGTEVSKDASDMILADDNFATIIKAVLNGRNVYRNIRNAILFLLSGNMAGIFTVVYTTVAGLPVPFAPVHLLFINLLTDSLPAIAIGMEAADDGLLNEKPRDASKGILTKAFFIKIFMQGFLISLPVIAAYHIGLEDDSLHAATMAFATLTLARLFHGFNCRSERPIFSKKRGINIYSVLAFFAGLMLLGLVIFIPILRELFSAARLTAEGIKQAAILSVLPTVLIQAFRFRSGKYKNIN